MASLNEKELRLEQLMPLIQEKLDNGLSVTFAPRGTSMLPMLRQGLDTVTLSPITAGLRKYDLPLYRRDNGQFVLHRIVAVTDTLTCIGDNQFELERGVRFDQMIGIVTAFSRRGRVYSVADIRYRIYCRVWHYTRPLRHIWRSGKSRLRRLLK